MKIRVFLKNGIQSMYAAIQRFPITILMTSLTSFLLIYLVHEGSSMDSSTLEYYQRITMTLALGIPLSLCIKRITEMKSSQSPWLFYLGGLLLLGAYYLFLLKDVEMLTGIRYAAVSIALYLGFIFLPYFSADSHDFELYTLRLGGRFFLTGIYTIVLFLGLAGIFFTIDRLLGISIKGEIYMDLWIASVGIFAPAFFLAAIPQGPLSKISFSFPQAFQVLLLYIVMPLLTAYTVILYLFFAKILVNQEWPQGLVAHLVLWYSIITTVVFFFIDSIRSKNKWAQTFYFWLSKLIVPILIIMFVSIGIRINEYGITSNRYFVVLTGLWVTGSILYLGFFKKPKTVWLLASLSILAFLSVFGPWSHENLSFVSQANRLEKLLIKNELLQENVIIPSSTVPKEDQIAISEQISYLNRIHGLDRLSYFPASFTTGQMDQVLGFSYQYPDYSYGREYFSYMSNRDEVRLIPTKDYDYFLDFANNYASTQYSLEDIKVLYDSQTKEISLEKNGQLLYHDFLSKFGEELYEKYGSNHQQLSREDLMFVEENENVKITFIFFNVEGEKRDDTVQLNYFNFYALIKIK